MSPGPVLRHALRVPGLAYRYHLGWLLGHRFLLLRHTGRSSGARYETVLEVLRYDSANREATVMSGWGCGADWFRNIEANGDIHIVIGRTAYDACHRVLNDDAAATILADYERRNRWMRPIVRRVLSGLAKRPYDGSPQARLTIVRALPIITFQPAASRPPVT